MLFGASKNKFELDTLGSPVLRERARPVAAVTPEIRALGEAMLAAMTAFNGVGLAAPQVGHSLRLVALGIPADAMSEQPTPGELELIPQMPLVLVNPEIAHFDDSVLLERDEGCLSLPDIFAPVVRPHRVVLQGQTLDGKNVRLECGGLLARCLQHELDHLDGILFIDRVAEQPLKEIQPELRRLTRFGEKHAFKRKVRR